LVLPEGSTILADPPALYGYESHDDKGDLVPMYRARTLKATIGAERRVLDVSGRTTLAVPPKHLKEQIAEDDVHRPEWMTKFYAQLQERECLAR
jgi:hypothetical protein